MNLSPKRITNVSDSYPVESPDGRSIAFQSNRTGNWEIYVMNADGKGLKQLTQNNAADNSPCWSPDGRKLLFVSERDGKEYNSEIYMMNEDGSQQKRLTVQLGDDSHPKFTPDGMHIIFNSARTTPDFNADWSDQVNEIFMMDLDGKNVRQITSFKTISTFPSVSPDGKKIAFRKVTNSPALNWDISVNRKNRNSEVFVMNIDGTGEVNISNSPAFDGWPTWSPDGSTVIFSSNRRGPANVGQLFVVDPEGKVIKQITRGEGGFVQPSFSANSKKIYAYQVWETSEYEYGNIVSFDLTAPQGSHSPTAFVTSGAIKK
jgi:Tol biopolymer transport system component